eukprot:s340_g4.t2
MFLATVHEMEQYALYLRSAPHKAAGLVSVCSDTETKNKILAELKQEWQLVLELEGTASGAALLKANCFHCTFQCFRETMSAYEKSNWKLSAEATGITAAWFPSFCQSASLESVFGDLSDACKRSGRNDCGSLPNLQCVAVRSLQNRLCSKDGAPEQVKLESADWEGNQAYGVKPKIFNPASAPACFQAIIDSFVLEALFASAQIICPISKAVRLRELAYYFTGKLPEQGTDETRIPCNMVMDEDPLDQGLTTPALSLDGYDPAALLPVRRGFPASGRDNSGEICFGFLCEVKLFGYTLHICEKSLEAKCGTAVLFRRGFQELPLMEYLVSSQQILLCTNASLTELLQQHDIQMPKNSTKPQRIRRILGMDQVKNACGDAKIQKLLNHLEEQEAKKKKKEKENEEQKDEASSHRFHC